MKVHLNLILNFQNLIDVNALNSGMQNVYNQSVFVELGAVSCPIVMINEQSGN